MILIDATHINVGGGMGLLRRLINELRGQVEFALLRDIRVKDLDTAGCRVFDAVPSHCFRRRFYRQHGALFSRVLCFGNVPPPIRLPAPTATYFHNVLFCENYAGEGWRERLQMALKMAYIRHYAENTDHFLVQTDNMVAALRSAIRERASVATVPFFALPRSAAKPSPERRWDHFAYVSEAHSHKNHAVLLAAWRRLLAQGRRPGLHLTVTAAYPRVLAEIAELKAAGAAITNHGQSEPAAIYARCGYQVYPSLLESFGLGLVEAADAGCAVLAAERPYVHAVVGPYATFDPSSAEALADLIRRCSGQVAPASVVKVADRLPELLAWLAHGTPWRTEPS
jgi:glycosyltransferase involved in cell wall biosynthesis